MVDGLDLLWQEMLSWNVGYEIWDTAAIFGKKQNFRENIAAKLDKRLQAHRWSHRNAKKKKKKKNIRHVFETDTWCEQCNN